MGQTPRLCRKSDNSVYANQDAGRVVRLSPAVAARFWAKVVQGAAADCWLWHGSRDPRGYGQLTISRISRAPVKAHRVAYALAHGRWPAASVLHSCDTPACVNPAHLRVGTQAENIREAIEKGRWQSSGPKLTSADRALIVALREAGTLQRDVARQFGVTDATVSRVHKNARSRQAA